MTDTKTCIEIPYGVAQDSFKTLSRYFSIVTKSVGAKQRNVFDFNQRKLFNIPTFKELSEVIMHVLANNNYGFKQEGEIVRSGVQDTIRNRGLTEERLLESLFDFQYQELGEMSGLMIERLITDMKTRNSLSLINFDIEYSGNACVHQRLSELINRINNGKKPFSLERILNIENSPLIIKHAGNKLYVLDDEGKIHQYEDNQKTKTWILDLPEYLLNRMKNAYHDPTHRRLPCIDIRGNELFLSCDRWLIKYDLNQEGKLKFKIIGQGRSNHDDVLATESGIYTTRSTLEGTEWFKEIAVSVTEDWQDWKHLCRTRLAIHSDYQNSGADYTRRLGRFNNRIYYAAGFIQNKEQKTHPTFIEAKDSQPHRIMLDTRDIELEGAFPITKFAFGDDYLVAISLFKTRDGIPLITTYKQRDDTWFDLAGADYIPKFWFKTLIDNSVSAHQKEFAVPHSDLKKVFVYKVN